MPSFSLLPTFVVCKEHVSCGRRSDAEISHREPPPPKQATSRLKRCMTNMRLRRTFFDLKIEQKEFKKEVRTRTIGNNVLSRRHQPQDTERRAASAGPQLRSSFLISCTISLAHDLLPIRTNLYLSHQTRIAVPPKQQSSNIANNQDLPEYPRYWPPWLPICSDWPQARSPRLKNQGKVAVFLETRNCKLVLVKLMHPGGISSQRFLFEMLVVAGDDVGEADL